MATYNTYLHNEKGKSKLHRVKIKSMDAVGQWWVEWIFKSVATFVKQWMKMGHNVPFFGKTNCRFYIFLLKETTNYKVWFQTFSQIFSLIFLLLKTTLLVNPAKHFSKLLQKTVSKFTFKERQIKLYWTG